MLLLQDPNPNWNDYMDPDEMEQFERWQKADANDEFGEYYYGPGGEGDDDMGDIVDPAEIPLCMEYADNAMCPRGDACSLIHGDQCEVSGSLGCLDCTVCSCVWLTM